MRYTKKPVTIEAVRFIGLTDFGDPVFDDTGGLPEWLMEALAGPEGEPGSIYCTGIERKALALVSSTKGPQGQDGKWGSVVPPGDWIVRREDGRMSVWGTDLFDAEYVSWANPIFVQAAKGAERSLLLDMQSECIQLRVALTAARDMFSIYERDHVRKAEMFEARALAAKGRDDKMVSENRQEDAVDSRKKAERNRKMAAMCQKAIDCRPATGSTEALTSALAETAVEHPSDLPNGSVDRLRGAAKPFVIGHGFSDTVGDSDGDDGA